MSQNASYHVDLALCIDATGSMGSIIDRVKAGALAFHDQLMAEMKKKDKFVDVLRVRVVAFRDYYVDSIPMLESPFFTLPAEQDAFKSFVSNIKAEGGGDEPENGLEALALAMQSNWTKEGAKRRHVIVVWTDATAHPLEKGGKPGSYPSSMPKNFDELTDMWEGQNMQGSAKRLVLFARESTPWSDIGTNWNQVVLYPSKAGDGLKEIDLEAILELIAASV
jgi:von Willebrand factor type A domain